MRGVPNFVLYTPALPFGTAVGEMLIVKNASKKGAIDHYATELILLDRLRWHEKMAEINEEIRPSEWDHWRRNEENRRSLYFSVENDERRRDLIQTWRALEKNDRAKVLEDVTQARRELEKIKKASEWNYTDAILGIFFIFCGNFLQGLIGALGGLVLAFVFVMKSREARARTRIASVQHRENMIRLDEARLAEAVAHRELFSEWEERHGKPDARHVSLRRTS